MRVHSYGKLFHHRADITGEWIQSLIQRISTLSCEFHEESGNFMNGINVSLRKKSVVDTKDILGEEIAEFIVCSYVIKNKKSGFPGAQMGTYLGKNWRKGKGGGKFSGSSGKKANEQYSGKKVEKKDTKSETKPKKTTPTKKTTFKKTKKVSKK